MADGGSKNWSMADVSAKPVTRRIAVAGGSIRLGPEAFGLLAEGRLPKGDPLAMAEIAGIQAAKQTPNLIPLCHPIALNRVMIHSFPRPDDEAVEEERMCEVRAAIEALPPMYREPFTLRHLEGWNYRQIAELLDVPVDTVETRLVRARRRLREALHGKV